VPRHGTAGERRGVSSPRVPFCGTAHASRAAWRFVERECGGRHLENASAGS